MALAKLTACAAGGAVIGGGAVHMVDRAERPALVKQTKVKKRIVHHRPPPKRRIVKRTTTTTTTTEVVHSGPRRMRVRSKLVRR